MKALVDRKIELEYLLGRLEALDLREFCYRADVIDILREAGHTIQATKEQRENIMGGLGRLVLEDYDFAESKLGLRLLKFGRDYREKGL